MAMSATKFEAHLAALEKGMSFTQLEQAMGRLYAIWASVILERKKESNDGK